MKIEGGFMDFRGSHVNIEVEHARESALENIDSINKIIEEFKSGESSGRVFSKLMSENSIDAALSTIREYEDLANLNNEKIDNKVIEQMEETKLNLIGILNQQKDDPDISELIDNLPPEINLLSDESEDKEPDSYDKFKRVSRKTIDD